MHLHSAKAESLTMRCLKVTQSSPHFLAVSRSFLFARLPDTPTIFQEPPKPWLLLPLSPHQSFISFLSQRWLPLPSLFGASFLSFMNNLGEALLGTPLPWLWLKWVSLSFLNPHQLKTQSLKAPCFLPLDRASWWICLTHIMLFYTAHLLRPSQSTA